VPKIDWLDDDEDQRRWEPRVRRERLPHGVRERRARLEQIIALAAATPVRDAGPTRQPLHLIWGVPVRGPASAGE
jgi:hypothetical protein